MIEAEIKARVADPDALARVLAQRAAPRVEIYRDTYYDTPDERLDRAGQELRVRTVDGAAGSRTVLTFKGAAVDEASGSKPERETGVEDAAATHALLRGLGYVPSIAFEKHCRNYAFHAYGRDLLATLVSVPELDGHFLEVETLAPEPDLAAALADVHRILIELGVGEADLTRELYTDAVRARRG
ncbi:class IV adenylate cyclase [Streptomyces sp. NPDC057638]|uniref:class IV adenylate cyclase n=1 Tax=Streptomyces sp. NPDC057638 TaxID=3346190 RepID=UPI0036790E90